jgi:DNA repair exonuclease SbcCD ATPase subunit
MATYQFVGRGVMSPVKGSTSTKNKPSTYRSARDSSLHSAPHNNPTKLPSTNYNPSSRPLPSHTTRIHIRGKGNAENNNVRFSTHYPTKSSRDSSENSQKFPSSGYNYSTTASTSDSEGSDTENANEPDSIRSAGPRNKSPSSADEQINEIWRAYQSSNQRQGALESEITKLRAENGSLKQENQRLYEELTKSTDYNSQLTTENKILQQEQQKVKNSYEIQLNSQLQETEHLRKNIISALDKLREEFVSVMKIWRKNATRYKKESEAKGAEIEKIQAKLGNYYSQLEKQERTLENIGEDVREERKNVKESMKSEKNKELDKIKQREREIEREIARIRENTVNVRNYISGISPDYDRQQQQQAGDDSEDEHNDSANFSFTAEVEIPQEIKRQLHRSKHRTKRNK